MSIAHDQQLLDSLQHLSTDHAANRRAFKRERLRVILAKDPELTDEQCAERLGLTTVQVLEMRHSMGMFRKGRVQ